MIGCNDPTCVVIRIHDNIEYTLVTSFNWWSNDPVLIYSSMWTSMFDSRDNWDVFTVVNAIANRFICVRNWILRSDHRLLDIRLPILAVQICLKQYTASNILALRLLNSNRSNRFTNAFSWLKLNYSPGLCSFLSEYTINCKRRYMYTEIPRGIDTLHHWENQSTPFFNVKSFRASYTSTLMSFLL